MLRKTLEYVFGHAEHVHTPMPVWEILHHFVVASADASVLPSKLSASEVDRRVRERVDGKLKFYSGSMHDMISYRPKGYEEFNRDPNLRILTPGLAKELYQEGSGQIHKTWEVCSCKENDCVRIDGNPDQLTNRQSREKENELNEEEEEEEHEDAEELVPAAAAADEISTQRVTGFEAKETMGREEL